MKKSGRRNMLSWSNRQNVKIQSVSLIVFTFVDPRSFHSGRTLSHSVCGELAAYSSIDIQVTTDGCACESHRSWFMISLNNILKSCSTHNLSYVNMFWQSTSIPNLKHNQGNEMLGATSAHHALNDCSATGVVYLYYKRRSLYLCSAKDPVLDGSGSRR